MSELQVYIKRYIKFSVDRFRGTVRAVMRSAHEHPRTIHAQPNVCNCADCLYTTAQAQVNVETGRVK